jgi:predicted  nucleic acid-binding Zn-ribbon protein
MNENTPNSSEILMRFLAEYEKSASEAQQRIANCEREQDTLREQNRALQACLVDLRTQVRNLSAETETRWSNQDGKIAAMSARIDEESSVSADLEQHLRASIRNMQALFITLQQRFGR